MTVRHALHCTESFIITLHSSRYDLNNAERDVKQKLIIIPRKHTPYGSAANEYPPIQLTLVISTSLISNNRLFRSENLICPWLNMKILQQVKYIVEKRRNCSSGAISPLFHNIFDISLNSRVQLHINLLNVVVRIIFSSILQIWYVEVRISRSISESPLEFEITRVDCMCFRGEISKANPRLPSTVTNLYQIVWCFTSFSTLLRS